MSDAMSREDRWADVRHSARPRSFLWAFLIIGLFTAAYLQLAHPLTAPLRAVWLAVGVCAAAAQVWRMTTDARGRDELQASFIRDGHRAGFIVAVFGALCLILTNQAIGLPVAAFAHSGEANASANVAANEVSASPAPYVKLEPSLLLGTLILPLLGSGVGFIWSSRKRTGR